MFKIKHFNYLLSMSIMFFEYIYFHLSKQEQKEEPGTRSEVAASNCSVTAAERS